MNRGCSLSGLYPSINPARLDLPGSKAPAGTALRVTEKHKLATTRCQPKGTPTAIVTEAVEYNGQKSSPNKICRGVPQGSILGPLFLILYINDLNNASKFVSIVFADDTNLCISHTDPDLLISILNCELDKLLNWFRTNKLPFNFVSKTHFMEFKP